MATALGFRLLCRHHEGSATDEQLDAAKTRGWVSQTEYDRAISGDPPIGYVPTPAAAIVDSPAD